ncbi:pyridoxamine 5'-phosphate oxidase family protein [Plantibacter flavus]|uniref:pyridoxamine 5'-phosphate oxidase family protein n=1 Tax=Plantibacter flavus TaxID=150123 RepID=UPI003F142862
MAGDTDPHKTLTDLLAHFRFAMLTTVDGDGKLVAHPLTVQEREFDGDLWFIVGTDASAVRQLHANPNAGVTLSSDSSWVSLAGTAALVEDRAKLDELWNGAVDAWFPDGPSDPRVGLLKFSADSAEYWDSPGGRIATAIALVKSKVTGETYEGDNAKVDL